MTNNMKTIERTDEQLKEDYIFSDAEERKYFIENPKMNKLILSFYDYMWSGGTINSYNRKFANMGMRMYGYHTRFEKLAKEICAKWGIDYWTSNFGISQFNDWMASERENFEL